MCSGPVVVVEVLGENAVKMPLVEHHNVIETLPPHGADQTFDVRILPGRPGSGEHLGDAESGYPMAEGEAVHSIAIPKQVPRGRFPGEGLHQLMSCPLSRRMLGHVEVEDLSPLVGQDEEAEQHLESGGRHGEEVDRDKFTYVVVEEAAPGRRRRLPTSGHVAGDGGLRDVEPELEQLTVDSRSTPERIRGGHPPDQRPKLRIDPRSTRAADETSVAQ